MKLRRSVGAAAVLAFAFSFVAVADFATAPVSSPASATSASISSNAAGAVVWANGHGYRTSVAVIDTSSGAFSGAGDYDSTYASESVVKTMIATELILTGQMTGWTQTTAYKMITQSDDASANALYGRVGGDGVINWIKQTFGIPSLGSPPPRPGWWGGTQITAHGLTIFYNAVRHNPVLWSWLGNAMSHATPYGSDGTYQFFGIPSATTGAAVKQGWGADDPAGQPAFNSTGFVNGNRYAVAILTQGGTYGAAISAMLTQEAQRLMPGGHMQVAPVAPVAPVVTGKPFGFLDSVSVSGFTATAMGWTVDPNATATAIRVTGYVNGVGQLLGPTGVARPDVNKAYRVTGAHGYVMHLQLKAGANTVCIRAVNVGPGSNVVLGCRTVTVNRNPFGYVGGWSAALYTATVWGWMMDPDAPNASIQVVVYVNRIAQYVGATNVLRPDVNAAFKATGAHGYSIALKLSAGNNAICVRGINVSFGANVVFGCRTITVNPNPFGFIDAVSITGHNAVVSGWTIDPDAPGTALTVSAYVNGRAQYYGASGVPRPDVNRVYKVTGAHGYAIPLKLTSGANRICTYAVNIGPGADVNLACRVVTVP